MRTLILRIKCAHSAGDAIYLCPYTMGRDPDLWEGTCLFMCIGTSIPQAYPHLCTLSDPNEFKPERWLDAEGSFTAVSDFMFPAFNAGPRTCIGRPLAYLEVSTRSTPHTLATQHLAVQLHTRYHERSAGGHTHCKQVKSMLCMSLLPSPFSVLRIHAPGEAHHDHVTKPVRFCGAGRPRTP